MASASVLPFMRGIDFSNNNLKKVKLRENAAQMCNLRWIRLNRTQLETMPDDVDNFTKLEVLSMTHNQLGDLYAVAPSAFPALKVVNARDNELQNHGISGDLFKLSELVTLDLSKNKLTKVPDDLKDAKDLIVLNLSHNKISSIPGLLFVHCSGLQMLVLSNNDIQSLPPQLRRLEHLTTLDIANNPMQHFSFKVLDKMVNLTTLNLSNTGRNLENTPHLDKLINLTDLDMSHNDLPRIPEQVYLLDSLTRIKFSHNLIRELSSLVDTWSSLVTLDLTHNLLTSIPPNISKCSRLKRLFLSDNKLTFEGIPPSISKLSALEHFVAARNCLECIPEGLCRCYSLKKLILTSNKLLTLPEAIHFLKVEKLDLEGNPNLTMPPKPQTEVKGSGAEFYNIDFDPKILSRGAVMAASKVLKGSYTKQKERYMKMLKHRKTSVTNRGDEASALKVLRGLAGIADSKQHSSEMSSDVMSVGAGVEIAEEEYAPKKPKRWDETLVRPDLDYSSIFADDTGSLPGLTIWQIENFYPYPVDEASHGQFYTADAYIVLKTFFNDTSELDWEIYYWIGKDTSVDKKACAAMHSVHLRNMLGARGRTSREEQGEESDAFWETFNSNINYIEGGTASGFYTVEEEEHVTYLYRVCGKKRLHLESAGLSGDALDHSHVYILDMGKTIFVWSGGKSKLGDRSKARLIAERIVKVERKNRATIQQFRAGNESDEFWEGLGGYPEEPVKATTEDATGRRPLMYKAAMGQGYLELPQVEIVHGQLVKALLKSKEVYILDCYSDIFVWIGRHSSRLVRAAALKLADELLDMMSRPLAAGVKRVLEGVEPMIFRLWFEDWTDVLTVDYTVTPELLEKRSKELSKLPPGATPEKKTAKVDLSALFLPRQQIMTSGEAADEAERCNSLLKYMQCCVIEGRKFNILPKEEKGHFYSAECYFFLCQYIVPNPDSGSSGSESSEEEGEELQTIVYFWQGRNASKMGWLQFTLGILKQLERAMGPIEVIRLQQQQEDFRFLSHFGGKFIIHWGKRGCADTSSKPALYQIRANETRVSRRVVQITARPKFLNPHFCFILKVPFENTPGSGIVYVWVGSTTTQEEAVHAEQIGRTIFQASYSNSLISEGSEPENFFWVALGGRGDYDKDADYMKNCRLFRCSNEKGYFSVSEKCADFCQGDLSNDDVMLLDNGKDLFIWFGMNASEIEKKLALKSAQVYIKFLADQEQPLKRRLRVAKRGSEPWDFTRCFHGWVSSR